MPGSILNMRPPRALTPAIGNGGTLLANAEAACVSSLELIAGADVAEGVGAACSAQAQLENRMIVDVKQVVQK